MKYYNLNLFHSVQSNFIAQTGSGVNSMDSNVKSGTGESVYRRLYGEQVELVSKDFNHLAAILHVYAGDLNFMK